MVLDVLVAHTMHINIYKPSIHMVLRILEVHSSSPAQARTGAGHRALQSPVAGSSGHGIHGIQHLHLEGVRAEGCRGFFCFGCFGGKNVTCFEDTRILLLLLLFRSCFFVQRKTVFLFQDECCHGVSEETCD